MDPSSCSSLDSLGPTDLSSRLLSYALADEVLSLTTLLTRHPPMDLSTIKDEKGFSLLHMACLNDQPSLLQHLLDYQRTHQPSLSLSPWVNSPTEEGFTALHFATFRGSLTLIRILSHHHADPLLTNHQGLSVIHVAAQASQVLPLLHFQAQGVNTLQLDYKGSSALHWACYQGADDAAFLLLHWGADPNEPDRDGQYPLHLAVCSGNVRLVRRLLIKGARLDSTDEKGLTPEKLARMQDHPHLEGMLSQPPCMQSYCNSGTALKPVSRHPGNVLLFFLLYLTTYLGKAFFLWPYLSSMAWLYPDLVSLLALLLCFLVSWLRDPGYIRHSARPLLDLHLEHPPSMVCLDCEQVRPPRSKHCFYCKACVSVFDHHCPWIDNCVGSNNHAWFLIFLWCTLANLVLQMVQIAFHLPHNTLLRTPLLFFHGLYTYKMVLSLLLLLLGLFFLIPLAYLLSIQTGNFLLNQTTFERFSHQPQPQSPLSSPSSYKDFSPATLPLISAPAASSSQNCHAMCCLNQKEPLFH